VAGAKSESDAVWWFNAKGASLERGSGALGAWKRASQKWVHSQFGTFPASVDKLN